MRGKCVYCNLSFQFFLNKFKISGATYLELLMCMSKAFKTAMGELHTEVEEVHFRAAKEAIFADSLGICKFAPTSTTPGPQAFYWDHDTVQKLSLDKEGIKNRVMQLLQKPDDDIQWSL